MKKHYSGFISGISFVIMIIISSMMVAWFLVDKKETAIERAEYIAKSQVSELDRSLSSYMQTTNTLSLLVMNSGGKVQNFEEVATQLYNDDHAFRSIQLAPNGVVEYVYPLQENEEAFGDIFADPDRKKEAEYARDTGKTTLAGPFELYQSGMGIVIRQPIYLTVNQKEMFWGFSIVVLNVPEIFDSVNLADFTEVGYTYKLWRIHPDTNKKQIILESSKEALIDPVEISFDVPGSEWTLSVSLKDGWIDYRETMPIIILMFFISLLIPALLYTILKINEQKYKMIEMSYQDYLTELYNGRKMSSVLTKLLKDDEAFTLIYLDIDRFKEVNDTYGHTIGDQLLKEMAIRIKKALREEDYAFRIGGDEFVVILFAIDDPVPFIDNFKAVLLKPLQLDKFQYQPKISLGYARYPQDASSKEELIRRADAKMYQMKKKKI